jgi:hypothetical protein
LFAWSKHQTERPLLRARFKRIDQCGRASLQRAGRLVPQGYCLARAGGQLSLQRHQATLVHAEGRQGLRKQGQSHIAQNPPDQRAAAGAGWTGNRHHAGRGIPFCEPFHQRPERLRLLGAADQQTRQGIAGWIRHRQVQFNRRDVVRKNAANLPQQVARACRPVLAGDGQQAA